MAIGRRRFRAAAAAAAVGDLRWNLKIVQDAKMDRAFRVGSDPFKVGFDARHQNRLVIHTKEH